MMASQIRPGLSKRADFSLIPSKSALLIIDVQDHLSSSSSFSTTGSVGGASSSSTTTERSNDDHDRYLFTTALPKALPKIVQLVENFRHIRDGNHSQQQDKEKDGDFNCCCEVLFTYLESSTVDSRDVSLDYKLSGHLLSTNLPNTTQKATFDNLPPQLRPNTTRNKGDIIFPKTSCSVFCSTNIHYVLRNLNVEQIVVCGQLTDQCVLSAVRDGADLGYFMTVVDDACAASSFEDHERGLLGMKGFARVVKTDEIVQELQRSAGSSHDDLDAIGVVVDANKGKIASNTKVAPSNTNKLILKPPHSNNNSPAIEALLHVLQYANIKFLRFASVDISNSIRTKVIPVQNLLLQSKQQQQRRSAATANFQLSNKVAIAKACFGGMPYYADCILPETKLDARHVLTIQPDVSSLRILPYTASSAVVFGTLHESKMRKGSGVLGGHNNGDDDYDQISELCTRGLLQRVLETARDQLGIEFRVGAEIEFILVRRRKCHKKDGEKTGSSNDTPIEPVDYTIFASTATLNDQDNFINDVYDNLQKQNIDIETLHSESAPGQMEVVLPYQADVVKLADMVVLARETIGACAKKHGLHALFLPKVFEQYAGNGMHVHLSFASIDNPDSNVFSSSGGRSAGNSSQGLLSYMGESFLEGILSHLKGLTSLTMPTVNSYRRVGPGCWTGHSISWMVEDKECPLRVCLDVSSSEATNLEYKLMDSTCNVYLALAGILFAGMEGISQKMKLRPMMINSPDSNDDDSKNASLPTNLEESLQCLLNDPLLCELLGEKLSTSYVAVKRAEGKYAGQKSLLQEIEEIINRG